MINRENTCKACEGSGMLADDEGWQYTCSVCHGIGKSKYKSDQAKVLKVDQNNRLLD